MTDEYAIKLGLRLCLADGKKGYFHKWDEICSPVAASLSVGGAPAGQYKRTFAIVEFEDGTVKRCEVDKIQFLDTTQPSVYMEKELFNNIEKIHKKTRIRNYDKL